MKSEMVTAQFPLPNGVKVTINRSKNEKIRIDTFSLRQTIMVQFKSFLTIL